MIEKMSRQKFCSCTFSSKEIGRRIFVFMKELEFLKKRLIFKEMKKKKILVFAIS
jgi:hypothetical protein